MFSDRDCGTKMEQKYEKYNTDMKSYMGSEYMTAMSQGYDNCCGMPIPGGVCEPIYECPQERVCHRYICHEVPHVCPCNTRIINHHVYRHSYTPTYSCCEENVVSNVYDNCCGRY